MSETTGPGTPDGGEDRDDSRQRGGPVGAALQPEQAHRRPARQRYGRSAIVAALLSETSGVAAGRTRSVADSTGLWAAGGDAAVALTERKAGGRLTW